MFILYDLIFLVLAVFTVPAYLFRKRFHRGFSARLGRLPDDLALNNPIWIHAVSVGEAIAVKGLLEELRKEFPNKKFVISTVTPTGNRIAKTFAREGDLATYLPLDFSFIVRRVIRRVRPALFIIVETEIWPNLIRCLYKRKIPVVIVNCRISDRSFLSYRMVKFLIRGILNKVSIFCSQSPADTERLLRLGVSQNKVVTSGNMKFDAGHLEIKFNTAGLSLSEKEQLLVCGSTHPAEEEMILSVYKEISGRTADLRLLLAPRHPERAKDIEKLVTARGFKPIRISRLSGATGAHPDREGVFILDTVGQLVSYYAIADIVFVGGSLVKHGGHNILEPASLAKAVIFGPHMFNFRDIADLFLKNDAAFLVRNQAELKEKIVCLLDDPDAALRVGQRSRKLVLENRGATYRNLELVKEAYAQIHL